LADAVKAAGRAAEEDVPFLGFPRLGVPPITRHSERATGFEDRTGEGVGAEMNGDVPCEGDVGWNGGAESAEGESVGADGFLVRVGGGREEGERVFEAECSGVMGVSVKRDANGVFACERAEAGEGFAEAVWVAERVFE
jgi:hypothetical protein